MRLFPAAFVIALTALPAVTLASSADAQTEQAVALTRFNKGRDLFIASNYAGALVEFRAATELVESPNTRLYMARCEKELGHLSRAFVEYQRASTEAADRVASDPRYASTRDAARQESATIEPMLGHVTLRGDDLPKNVIITLGGSPMSAAALGVSAPVDPGRVSVTARANGYKSFQKTVDVAAGADVDVPVHLEVDPDAPHDDASGETNRDHSGNANDDAGRTSSGADKDVQQVGGGVRIAGYVVGGVGAVGVVMFATFAVMANNRFNQLQNACGTRCDATYNSQIDEGRRNQLIANVSLGTGVGLLLAGAIMIAAGGPKTTTHTHVVTFVPSVGPSPDGRGFGLGMFHAF